MAFEDNRIARIAPAVGAIVLAAAIPIVGLFLGRVNAAERERLAEEERARAAALWQAKDQADSAADSQENIEKQLTAHQLAVLDVIAETIPGIVCWGDSITAGVGGETLVTGNATVSDTPITNLMLTTVTYPSALQSLLRRSLADSFNGLFPDGFTTELPYTLSIPVVNMGVAGESSLTVAGRNGAIPYVLTEAVTIPADNQTAVRVTFTSQGGEAVAPLVLGSKGIDSVTLGGVKGQLELRQTFGEETTHAYYFRRSVAGEAADVEAGTPIIPEGSESYKDYLAVIQLGQNGGYENAADLIAQIKAIAASQNDPERYIVLGLSFGDADELQTVNAALAEAFGEHFIDVWSNMRTDGLAAAGIAPSIEDGEAIAAGKLPIDLTSGANSFNSKGYEVLAGCIQRKMIELGYLDAVYAALGMGEA